MKKKQLLSACLALCLLPLSATALAEDYVIDSKGAHASINFKIAHLGYSWLIGRFNEFSGTFSYDEKNPSASTVNVTINTASVDSNHAERDKHLRSDDFLDVAKYPKAEFKSTSYRDTGDGAGVLEGTLSLHGVTKPITIQVKHVGAGDDPWGGYRRGFEGQTRIALKDFGIKKDLGPASQELDLDLHIEGIRQ